MIFCGIQVETLPSVDRFIVSDFCNETCPEACDKNWKFYNKHGIYEVDPDLTVSCGIIYLFIF